jgi:hypothetical protein
LISHKNTKNISKIGKELESCSSWLVDPRSPLHLGKTKYNIIRNKLKKLKEGF